MLDLDDGFVTLCDDLERPVLLVTLDFGVVEFAADETFCVKDGVFGVRVEGVLGGITDTGDAIEKLYWK